MGIRYSSMLHSEVQPACSVSPSTLGSSSLVLGDFLEWFRGFADAEGCFEIKPDRKYFGFHFIICLHLNDIEVLNLIQKTLGIGKIYKTDTVACLAVVRQEDINKII